MTVGVQARLSKKLPGLQDLCGSRPNAAYDKMYLTLYKENLHDNQLRHRPGEDSATSKARLDKRCQELVEEWMIQEASKRNIPLPTNP